jgi:hypothetical protein
VVTASPAAVSNDVHPINTVPDAAVRSARFTMPLMVVSAGACACNRVENFNPISITSSSEITTSAAIGKHL